MIVTVLTGVTYVTSNLLVIDNIYKYNFAHTLVSLIYIVFCGAYK